MQKQIIQHFKDKDPILYNYINKELKQTELTQENPDRYFFKLTREIASQQLSNKAAQAIFTKFKKLFPNEQITPNNVINSTHERLRSSGISNSKASYIRNIAEAVVEKRLDFKNFHKMQDEDIIEALTQIKGIGRWTAEMFLMFTLAREDVFSHGDLGLRKAIKNIYGYKKEPKRSTIERIVKKWSPYKTYGCLILWNSIDGKGII
jgi:DNA-3-methyladenine glycosylase II